MTSQITTIYGTQAHFIRKDGTLLVSSQFQEGILSSSGKLGVEHAGDASLIHVVQQLKEKPADRLISFRNVETDRVFFGAYLAGPEWYLVSSVPRTALLHQVQAAYRKRWIVVLMGMLAILAIPVLAISRLLLPSLGKIVEAVMQIRAGDLNVRFTRDRVRELNHVSDALNDMVVALSTSTAERETNLAALAASEQKTREMLEEHMKDEQELRNQLAVIQEQQRTIMALSTPIIEVWEDVLALPVIGGFDQQRAAQATQVLLDAITRVQARTAILDLTGVDKVDQATATHLLELVQAVKLIGADVIVTGLRAEVARGLIACGANLSAITTKSTLREAIRVSRKSNKTRA